MSELFLISKKKSSKEPTADNVTEKYCAAYNHNSKYSLKTLGVYVYNRLVVLEKIQLLQIEIVI